MGVLGTILVKLAISVLSYFQGRADYRALIEKEMENAGLKRLAEASKWMLDSGDAGGELRSKKK